MRVAVIGSKGYPYVYGGYETFVRELCERLVRRGLKVTVYCHRGLFSDRPKRLKGIDLVYIPAIETKILSQLTHSFLSMIHACLSRADIILAVNTANGPFGAIARIFRKPTAINLDGMEWERPKWKGLGAKYFYFASWLSTKLYDHLINDSDAMRRVYLDLFGRDSTVIAYGANKRFSQKPDLIKEWALRSSGYYLVVGRLIPDNNSDLIVEGFLKSGTAKKLVIVGDVPYRDKYASDMKAKAAHDNRLIFTGYVRNQEQLAELYHHCYCYLHGHEYGGTNPTMLKAMAYGCAILALSTPFNREMLQEGKHGLFFEKRADAVASLLDDADKNPQAVNDLQAQARDGITERYDWDRVTEQYRNLFEKILKNR